MKGSRQTGHSVVRLLACLRLRVCIAEQCRCEIRDLTNWTLAQKKSYKRVAERFQDEKAAYYALLALGLVGSVKQSEFKATIDREESGCGIVL